MRSVGRGRDDADSTADPTPIRVLHVEDDPAFADLTATYLERDDGGAPVDVVTETDPRDAVDAVPDVDCVVSDYEMPGMDGLELLATVQDDHPELPFILFTGKGNEAIASEAISAGVTDYLQKESGTDQYAVLANTIRNAVARRRAREEAERAERRLRRALDLLPQCVVVKNLDGEYLLVNEAAAAQHEATRSELEGTNESDYFDDEQVEQWREEDREVMESGEPLHVDEQRVVSPDGTKRVQGVSKIPFDAPWHDEPAVMVVAEELTSAVERDRRLDEASDRVAEALDELDADRPDEDRIESLLESAKAFADGDRDVME